ncbi:MAG: sensor histidine kinase [Actinomycetota bacterium]
MESTTRRWLIDALAAVAVAGALCLRAAAPFEEEALPPDWRAYGLMILIGVLLLARRRFPLGILMGSLAALLGYYMLGFGAVGATWPLAPALFNAALLGRWEPAAWTAGGLVGGSSFWRLLAEAEESTLLTLSDILTEIVTATAVILAGAIIHSHRRLHSEIQARERAVAAERDAEARTRLSEQRLAIARDVHDIVAHSLSGIGVQARLAEEVLDSDTGEARLAIQSIIASTREAMSKLRTTVGELRSPPPPTALREIVDGVTGVEVDLTVEGEKPGSAEIEAALAAIVREALTNVLRHSGAGRARVTVIRGEEGVSVEIVDDGRGGDFVAGHGIRGMRERVAALGGTLETGPSPPTGFRVAARIPR